MSMIEIRRSILHSLEIGIAFISLLFGGLIYIVFRPKRLIMFSWFEDLHISKYTDLIRNTYSETCVYDFVKYSLPAGLWLLSYMLVIDVIWRKNKTYLYYYFLLCLPICALSSEFIQICSFIPGTFDLMDLFSYLLSIFVFIVIKFVLK